MAPATDFDEPRRSRGRGRGRGRPRGRPRGSPRGLRINKRKIVSDDEAEEENDVEKTTPLPPPPPPPRIFDSDCDISSLEAPTFTTLDRGPPAPMLHLTWDHPVSLIGEKVLSPRIHTCDTCNKPILIYGRMIPCKHVFCLTCAKRDDRVCSRCGERVSRVEQTGLGTVFMCTITINDANCKRTYLSARDLQAHIDHRHKKGSCPNAKEEAKEERISHRDPRAEPRNDHRPDPRGNLSLPDPRVIKEPFDIRNPYPSSAFTRPTAPAGMFSLNPPPGPPLALTLLPSPSCSTTHHIPVMTSARTNLITVPIQDPSDHQLFPNMSNSLHPPSLLHPVTHSHSSDTTHSLSHSSTHPSIGHSQSTTTHPPSGGHSITGHPSSSGHLPPHMVPPHSSSHPHSFSNPPPVPHSQPLPFTTSSATFTTPFSSSQQSCHYTYASTPLPPPQAPSIPPPIYPSNVPGSSLPQSNYGNRGGSYDNQYPGNQWTAAPPQQPPPPLHHPPPPPPTQQSNPYYR